MTRISSLLIGFVMVFILIIPATAGMNQTRTNDGKLRIENGSYWIEFDPIGDHIVGNPVQISGTTNLSSSASISYEFGAPTGTCHTKICTGKSPGTGGSFERTLGNPSGISSFASTINTSDFQSNLYTLDIFIASNRAESEAFSGEILVDPVVFLYPEEIKNMLCRKPQ